jgi:hypothetical protein
VQPALDIEQSPPFHLPLRFFLTAPLFGMLAGLLLVWQGPDALASRWHPGALALTHLMTLGFAGMIMAGALIQILPVVAGATLTHPATIAVFVHAGMTVGALLLPAAFLTGRASLFVAVAAILAITVAVFVAAAGPAAFRSQAPGPTVTAIRIAIAALAITVALGVILGLGRAAVSEAPGLTTIHAAWGLAGWTGLLVAGVAYRVVPTFQVTPSYPAWLTRSLAPVLLTLLVVWSIAMQWGLYAAGGLLALPVAALLATFGTVTLRLQRLRRRHTPDITVSFWRVGMLCLVCAAVLWAWLGLVPQSDGPGAMPLALGVLVLAGAIASVICGMLYKIVPFLAWLHLETLPGSRGHVPNMKEMMSERPVRLQFFVHCGALLLTLGAVVDPASLTRIAGAAVALSFGLLEWNLGAAALRYRRVRVRLEALAPPQR